MYFEIHCKIGKLIRNTAIYILITQHVRASQSQLHGQRLLFHFYRHEPFLNIVTNTTNIRLDKINIKIQFFLKLPKFVFRLSLHAINKLISHIKNLFSAHECGQVAKSMWNVTRFSIFEQQKTIVRSPAALVVRFTRRSLQTVIGLFSLIASTRTNTAYFYFSLRARTKLKLYHDQSVSLSKKKKSKRQL